MGSGKTTLGEVLAVELGCKFIDLDDYIEAANGCTIKEIFARIGEDGFRRIEHEAIIEASRGENVVIACGGGTPCFYNNMASMNSRGITVHLTTSEDVLYNRLTLPEQMAKRPLIASKTPDEIRQFIHESIVKRLPHYSQAQITFDSTDIETAEANAATAKILADTLRQHLSA